MRRVVPNNTLGNFSGKSSSREVELFDDIKADRYICGFCECTPIALIQEQEPMRIIRGDITGLVFYDAINLSTSTHEQYDLMGYIVKDCHCVGCLHVLGVQCIRVPDDNPIVARDGYILASRNILKKVGRNLVDVPLGANAAEEEIEDIEMEISSKRQRNY